MKQLKITYRLSYLLFVFVFLFSTHVIAQFEEISSPHQQQYLKSDSLTKNILIIRAEGPGGSDQTKISFNHLATTGYDKDMDQLKIILANSRRPQIFTFADTFMISINLLPDTTMLDMALQVSDNGIYTVGIERNIGFDYLVLEDLIWEKKINLLEEDYSFEYFTSDGYYPFKLYFSDWALQPIEESDVEIYYYPESLVIRSKKQVDFAEINIFDLAGRKSLSFYEKNFFLVEKPISLPTGHYIVQLRSGDLVVNKKILVRR